jgi:XTP/dITP diphosphohydrolase
MENLMNEIILATNNDNKKKEFSEIFGSGLTLYTLKEKGFKEQIIENGRTFIDNSLIKCKAVFKEYKKPVLADDSGLSVEELKGAPGIFSARFGGEDLTDKERNTYLLKLLKNVTSRKASFICALTLYINPNTIYIIQEELKGEIIDSPRGINGFGYDPIFYLPELKKTVAELTNEEKNDISHRGKAAKLMQKIIKEKLITL